MTLIAPAPVLHPVRYEFETVTVARPVHTISQSVREVWPRALAIAGLAIIAAQFLFTPVLQSRSQVMAARELSARFDTARGAVGMTDLTPLPNEPVAVGTAIAALEIPRLGVSQVVVEGASAEQLQSGPGHLSGTAGIGERGVSIVAGKRAAWGAPFVNVPSLRTGDVITTTTVAGTMTYKVSKISKTAPDVRAETGNLSRLVLVTSTPAGLATGDVFVIADSVKPAYPATPQNRLPDGGLRQGQMAQLPVAGVWLALIVLFVGLARYWVRAGIMDRVLAWSLAAPVVLMLGLLALRAITAALPATL